MDVFFYVENYYYCSVNWCFVCIMDFNVLIVCGQMECWNLFDILLFMFGKLAYAVILANGYCILFSVRVFIGYCIMDVFFYVENYYYCSVNWCFVCIMDFNVLIVCGQMECWNLFDILLFMFGKLAYAVILANGYCILFSARVFIGYCIMDGICYWNLSNIHKYPTTLCSNIFSSISPTTLNF